VAVPWRSGSRTGAPVAEEIRATLTELGLADGPVAVDRLDTLGFLALQRAGLDLVEWGTTVERAREIKLLKINGAIGDAVLVSCCPPLPTTLDCLACHERADAAILRVRSPSGGHLIADLQSRAPSPIA
jgi:hypothetical protein